MDETTDLPQVNVILILFQGNDLAEFE